MKLPGSGFNWRRMTKMTKMTRRQLAIGLSLLALIVTSASMTALVIRPAGAKKSPHIKKEHDDPREAGKYFQLRHYGSTLPAADARAKALAKAKTIPQYPTRRGTAGTSTANILSSDPTATWTPLGPQPIDSTPCFNPDPNLTYCNGPYGNNAGRVTALAVDPTDTNTIWVGTAEGGLWRSTDGGVNYTVLSDTWQTMAIGSIAIDPGDHNTVYVGTGEANFNGDGYWGAGIFKTTNGTMTTPTWTQLGFNTFGGMSIGKLAVDPHSSANVLAAVTVNGGNGAFSTTPPGSTANWTTIGGIWRSTNGGSTWSQVLKDSSTQKFDYGTEVLFDPAHAGVAYAGLANVIGFSTTSSFTSIAGVYKSTNSGSTWTKLNLGTLPDGAASKDIERVALGLAADGTRLYVALSDGNVRGSPNGEFGMLLGSRIWVSTNITSGSPTFTSHTVPDDMATAAGGFQYWYDLYVAVDPTNADVAYVGGVDIYQTPDGGTGWTNLTDVYGAAAAHVHPDQHALAFLNGTADFYLGNDGGVWKATSSATSYTNLNGGGLNITQFYGGSYGDVGGASGTLYGGTQDNGELQYTGTALSGPTIWNEAFGGDGGSTVVDYTDNHIVYEEYVDGNIHKSTDGGSTWNSAMSGLNICNFDTATCPDNPDDVNFIMPFVMSPSTPDTLFAGTDRVYRSNNSGGWWSAPGGKPDPNTSGWTAEISALAVAPTSNNQIYAGTNGGKFYHSTDGAMNWDGGPIPDSTGGVLTGIAVDPTTPNVVYATFANFAGSAGHHVFKSTTFGLSWTDISKGLPDVPFESILVNPHYPGLVIAGSDAGVFASTNGGSTWYTLGTGLPNVAINQLFTSHDGSKLFVATHGRGMWVLSTASLLVTPATPITATVPVGFSSGAYIPVVVVTNAGFTPMTYTLDTTGMPSCLSLLGSPWGPPSFTLNPGEHVNVALKIDTTAPGMCAFNATFTANGLVPSVTVPVAVEVSNLSNMWYFAEGYTGTGFDEWLTLANPGNSTANVQVTYLIQGSSTPKIKSYTVNPRSRFTVKVNNEVGFQKSVSMAISSSQPIIAERPMYIRYGLGGGTTTIPGGTSLMGATSLGTDYDFGYVDTTPNHDTWFTILNQNDTALNVTIDYYNGTTGVKTTVTPPAVPAHSRGSLKVNTQGLPAGTYSSHIHFNQPALVERPMYFKDSTTGRPGITDVLGGSGPQTNWYFADGQTDSTHRELFIISNPSDNSVQAFVHLYGQNGNDPTSGDRTIPAHGQIIVDASTFTGGLNGLGTHGARVGVDGPGLILVDRYISQHFVGPLGTSTTNSTVDGATDSTGTATPGQAYYFAEGYTGGKSAEFLELANPDPDHAAQVYVSYLPSNGSAAVVRVYTVPAYSQLRITTSTVMKGTSFSLAVLADRPIVAERTMEFIYGLTTGTTVTNVPGANVVVGYQP